MTTENDACDVELIESPDDTLRGVNYSLNPTELTRRVLALQSHVNQIANHAQGLPSREEFSALCRLVDQLTQMQKVQHHTMQALATAVEAALAMKVAA